MYLNHLCQFPTEEEFRLQESKIPKPWVVLIKDVKTVFYKELEKTIIKAIIDTTPLYQDGVFKDPNNKKIALCQKINDLESITIHATNNTSISDKKISYKENQDLPIRKQHTITKSESKTYTYDPNSGEFSEFSSIHDKFLIGKKIKDSIYIPSTYSIAIKNPTGQELNKEIIFRNTIFYMKTPGSTSIMAEPLSNILPMYIADGMIVIDSEKIDFDFNPIFYGDPAFIQYLEQGAEFGVILCAQLTNNSETETIESFIPYEQVIDVVFQKFQKETVSYVSFDCDIVEPEENPIIYEVTYHLNHNYCNKTSGLFSIPRKDQDQCNDNIVTRIEKVIPTPTYKILNTSNMFAAHKTLTSVSLFDTSSVTNMDSMFANCTSLTNVPEFNTSSVTNMNRMFSDCITLNNVPLFDTNKTTNMNQMFYNCDKLASIPEFDTSNVADMGGMFANCTSLTSVPQLDTSSVANMNGMFINCTSLTSVPKFNTSNVKLMGEMFYDCTSLTSVPLFDTSNVTDISGMFNGCTSLTSVPQLDTNQVENMSNMFNGCTSLTSIPLFDTSNVYSMDCMFANCTSLINVRFKGGVNPDCYCDDMFGEVTTTGILYLDTLTPANGNTWSPIISALPSTWTVVYNKENYKIRVIKDNQWLTGNQNLILNGQKLNYEGQGLYSTDFQFNTIDEYNLFNTDLTLDGVKIGTVKRATPEQIITVGDDSSVFVVEKVGADILTLPNENPDGWAYDDTVKGIKSNNIQDSESTTLKLTLPGNNFTVTIGQNSEYYFDYAVLMDGAGNVLKSYEGLYTDPESTSDEIVFSGTTPDKILQFKYAKDEYDYYGLDAFWIKKIVCENYPPYPEV